MKGLLVGLCLTLVACGDADAPRAPLAVDDDPAAWSTSNLNIVMEDPCKPSDELDGNPEPCEPTIENYSETDWKTAYNDCVETMNGADLKTRCENLTNERFGYTNEQTTSEEKEQAARSVEYDTIVKKCLTSGKSAEECQIKADGIIYDPLDHR